MSFVWPQEKVAFDIVEDKSRRRCRQAFDPDFVVVTATCAELEDYQVFHNVADALCALLGISPSERNAAWFEAHKRLFEGMTLTFGGL